MTNIFLLSIIIAFPGLLFLVAILSKFIKRVSVIKKLSAIVSIYGIFSAFYGAFLLINLHPIQTELLGFEGLGFSFRLDTLSVIIYSMIALLAFVIIKFSFNYLDGDERQGIFIGRLATAIAMVEVLVLSGNLFVLLVAWIGISLALHQLLIFYPNRPKAIVAAKKKFIFARAGDVFLLASVVLLYNFFGTGDLNYIFNTIATITETNLQLEFGVVFLVLAALFKSAQFPVHGWLIEVMETPTPVSATLHAGLLNAGPFLMVRMAYLLNYSSAGSIILVVVGGITAIFAAIAFTTQPAQKTALAYSSIAHMGFSLLTSGFGLYPAAILHLVGHSFYKGHAFLSSGTAVELIRSKKVKTHKRKGNVFKIIIAFTLSLGVTGGCAILWGITPTESFGLFALGTILMLALTQLLTTAFDSDNHAKAVFKTIILSVFIANAFFAFESGIHALLVDELPTEVAPSGFYLIIMLVVLALFSIVIFVQIFSPNLPKNGFTYRLGIHFRNGWYINAYFDKWIGALSQKKVYDDLDLEEEKVAVKVQSAAQ